MIDLLQGNLGAPEIAGVLKQSGLRRPMPPMDAPDWEAARKKPAVLEWMKSIRALAETEAFEPLPPLPDELYALFYKTGQRRPFETVYMERRRRLARTAMMVLMGDAATRDRFSPALVEKIEGIMGEESWTFPAHAWTQPSGKDPFKIDLFAAETGNQMGELLNLFAVMIPDELQCRIKRRLREQLFDNYLQPRSEITWKRSSHNWNAVCHQGVIGAVLAVEDDLDLIAELLASSAECLRIFLTGFGADGSTSEGPGYWSYGFGRFAELNRQLEAATGGALSYFGQNEHIRRIAQFAPALVFSNGHLVNFSDGSRHGRLDAPLLGYLGERLDLPLLREESAAGFWHQAQRGLDLNMERCDVFALTRLFLRCPQVLQPASEPTLADAWFPDYGAVVWRGRDSRGNLWEFAAKGGHNAEHHNHNDCGSYILNLNGQPAIVEIGAPEYVGDYFSSDQTRYTYLAARSLGHSVPLVNGCEQSNGAEFAARVLEYETGANSVRFVVDLTHCYPVEAKCLSLVRTFVFEKSEGRLQITDSFELGEPGYVESMLICDAAILEDNSGVSIGSAGAVVRITPQNSSAYKGFTVCPYHNRAGEKAFVNRLAFSNAQQVEKGEITCVIEVVSIRPAE